MFPIPEHDALSLSARISGRIQRTAHRETGAVQDVSIDLSGRHLLVAEQFLNRADIRAAFEQVRGKGGAHMA